MLAADYPFLDILWTMLIFFAWVIWFWLLITVFADIFRRHDISAVGKGRSGSCFVIVAAVPRRVHLSDRAERGRWRSATPDRCEAQQAQLRGVHRRRRRRVVGGTAARDREGEAAARLRTQSRRPSSTRSRPRRSLHRSLSSRGSTRPPGTSTPGGGVIAAWAGVTTGGSSAGAVSDMSTGPRPSIRLSAAPRSALRSAL